MLVLPYASGLTKVKIDTHHKPKHQNSHQKRPNNQETHGYIPPDELYQLQNAEPEHQSKSSSFKEKFQLTQDDMPLKITLNDSEGLRKRKKEKLDLDTNPNNYDYDIDELIAEESQTAKEQQLKEFYKNQPFGKEREEMV